MRAPFKYSGGKTREAKFISTILPEKFERIVEPFAGSCALSFFLEKQAIVGDTRKDVIHVLQTVAGNKFSLLQGMLDSARRLDTVEKLHDEFYRCRDKLWSSTDVLERAYRFIIIRQLVFSGIDRSNNKTGKENAPYGWYPKFSCNIDEKHHDLTSTWDIAARDFSETISLASPEDFIFVDPPYLSRNSNYGADAPDIAMHDRLMTSLLSSKSKFMIVHCEHEFYDEIVKKHGLNVVEKPHAYSQNFMGRDNSKAKTRHLYIMNY